MVLQTNTKLGKVQILGVNELQINNVLQDVDLYISFPSKFWIQILKKELNSYYKSQQDELFLKFIFVQNSTCLGQTSVHHQDS